MLEYLYYLYKECIPDEAKSAIQDITNSLYSYLISIKSLYEYYCPVTIRKGLDTTITFLESFFIYPIGAIISQTLNYVSAIAHNRFVEPFFEWFRSMAWVYMREALSVLCLPILFIRDIMRNPLLTWQWILRCFRGVGGYRTRNGILHY
jgi:hypothetical protein